jgi:putative transcriptional regulator
VLGCAGWAPGQLEHEIGAGAWLPASVDSALLFDMPLDEIWDEAYRRSVGAEPAAFTGERGRA